MTWEEFKAQQQMEHLLHAKETNIECPKCGQKLYVRTDIVLTSYPPKRNYFCNCGWSGIA